MASIGSRKRKRRGKSPSVGYSHEEATEMTDETETDDEATDYETSRKRQRRDDVVEVKGEAVDKRDEEADDAKSPSVDYSHEEATGMADETETETDEEADDAKVI